MHGRVEYVKGKRLAKKDKKGNLIYKNGEGWYINQWMAPTSKSFENGDVIFGWQNPVPLSYNPDIHGTDDNPLTFDHQGRTRYDTYDLIKELPPITSELMDEIKDLSIEARDIMDESFYYLTKQTEESFKNILRALMKHLPKQSLISIKNAIVDGKFHDKNGKNIWTKEEKNALQELENKFTKWSLEAPFKPTMDIANYKK